VEGKRLHVVQRYLDYVVSVPETAAFKKIVSTLIALSRSGSIRRLDLTFQAR